METNGPVEVVLRTKLCSQLPGMHKSRVSLVVDGAMLSNDHLTSTKPQHCHLSLTCESKASMCSDGDMTCVCIKGRGGVLLGKFSQFCVVYAFPLSQLGGEEVCHDVLE